MIEFKNISKKYKNHVVIDNLSFNIEKGQIVAFIGGSGCGKTTLLKMINRLIKPTNGKIYINNEDIEGKDVIELRRNIGYVIQSTGLFPHMTIRENIEIIPKMQKRPIKEIADNTIRLMEMVGLNSKEFLDRYPNELSGGQQQRVGVARAFATDPEIILMDEPFSALDPITRNDLQDELVNLQAKMKKTIVFVTHDMDEAIKIADKICILNNHGIVQYDTPENILKNPSNDFVLKFVGKNRIWDSPEFIKVSDIMIENPVVCYRELTVLKCIDKMRMNKVDSLLIVDSKNRKLEGIVKAKQIRSIEDKSVMVGDVMKTKCLVLSPHDSILDALKLVNKTKISTIPVLGDNNVLVGLITMSVLVTTLSKQYIDLAVE